MSNNENCAIFQPKLNKNARLKGEELRESLNSSGDWAIYVNNATDKPLKYKLWIGIE